MYGVVREYEEHQLWAGDGRCQFCNANTSFSLAKLINRIDIMIIPFLWIRKGLFVKCDTCGASQKVNGKQYNEMLKRQMMLLEQGSFTRERAAMDCSSTSVISSVFKTIFSALLAVISVFVISMSAANIFGYRIKAEDLIVFFVVLAIFGSMCIPFVISVKNLLFKLKKKSVYKRLYAMK